MSIFQKRQLVFPFLFTILIIGACSKPVSRLAEYGPVFENVMRSDTGAFRGFSLGDKMDSVKAKEHAKPSDSDETYLYYEYKINDSLGSYNISYNFDETGLNEIQSEIFISNSNNTDTVFAGFKNFFDKHYGASEDHMGYTVWTVRSEKYGTVQINLRDESAAISSAKGPGKIALWIYPDKD